MKKSEIDQYNKLNSSQKIVYLFGAYKNSTCFQEHEDSLWGILDMIEGLEYHYKAIIKYEKRARKKFLLREGIFDFQSKSTIRISRPKKGTNYFLISHEAVAYINRLGQLFYLFTSKWFKNIVPELQIAEKIPTILALMPIRNKYVAHRQQDLPRNDDCHSLGLHQHGLYPTLIGENHPETMHLAFKFPTKQRNELLKKYRTNAVQDVEHFGDNNHIVSFIPAKIHSVVICECVNLIERFFSFTI